MFTVSGKGSAFRLGTRYLGMDYHRVHFLNRRLGLVGNQSGSRRTCRRAGPTGQHRQHEGTRRSRAQARAEQAERDRAERLELRIKADAEKTARLAAEETRRERGGRAAESRGTGSGSREPEWNSEWKTRKPSGKLRNSRGTLRNNGGKKKKPSGKKRERQRKEEERQRKAEEARIRAEKEAAEREAQRKRRRKKKQGALNGGPETASSRKEPTRATTSRNRGNYPQSKLIQHGYHYKTIAPLIAANGPLKTLFGKPTKQCRGTGRKQARVRKQKFYPVQPASLETMVSEKNQPKIT